MRVVLHDGPQPQPADLLERIKSGGEGDVYAVAGRTGFVAKIYRNDSGNASCRREMRRKKIRTMLTAPPGLLSVRVGGNSLPLLGWPTCVIETEEREFCGFLMLDVRTNACLPLALYLLDLAKGKLLAENERCLPSRVTLCRSLAGILADLHRQGHYMVDLKPENVMVFRDSCIPCLLDNDSFSIATSNGGRLPASAYTQEYACPELLQNASADWVTDDTQDRFGLALLIFLILNRGIHPYQGIRDVSLCDTEGDLASNIRRGLYAYGVQRDARIEPAPGSIHESFTDATRALFDRAFQSASTALRPSAEEWRQHFDYLLQSKSFVSCARAPSSALHIHFNATACSECQLQQLRAPLAAEPEELDLPVPPSPFRWWHLLPLTAVILLVWLGWYFS